MIITRLLLNRKFFYIVVDDFVRSENYLFQPYQDVIEEERKRLLEEMKNYDDKDIWNLYEIAFMWSSLNKYSFSRDKNNMGRKLNLQNSKDRFTINSFISSDGDLKVDPCARPVNFYHS